MIASIIVPTHRRHDSLVTLVHSLENQTLTRKDFEIVIVSNLNDKKLSRRLPKALGSRLIWHLHVAGKVGVNRARNVGLDHSTGKFLFFLDDDCFLDDRRYLQKGIDYLQAHPDISALGGPYTLNAHSNGLEQAYNGICRQWLESSVRKSGFTTNLVGGNMVFRQSVFSAGLRFNEEIIFGGAETELHARLIQQGYRLKYDPNFTVEHRLHLNWRTFFNKAFWQGFGASRREDSGFTNAHRLPSVSQACAYPSKLTELYLLFFDHSFQMGWKWAKKNPDRHPHLHEVTSLFIFILKNDLTLNKYKHWLRWPKRPS